MQWVKIFEDTHYWKYNGYRIRKGNSGISASFHTFLPCKSSDSNFFSSLDQRGNIFIYILTYILDFNLPTIMSKPWPWNQLPSSAIDYYKKTVRENLFLFCVYIFCQFWALTTNRYCRINYIQQHRTIYVVCVFVFKINFDHKKLFRASRFRQDFRVEKN